MKLLDSNADANTWVYRGREARALMARLAAMHAVLADIDARAHAAAKPIQDEAEIAIAASLERHHQEVRDSLAKHEAEVDRLKDEANARLATAYAALRAEGEAASDEFHRRLWEDNPRMSRSHLPVINVNQYQLGSKVITILERLK